MLRKLPSRAAPRLAGGSSPALSVARTLSDGGLLDPVETAMTPDPPSVSVGMPAARVRAMLADAAASAVVVVDPDERPHGILTRTDVLAAPLELDRDLTAGQLASGLLFWLPPQAPVAQAAALMAYEGIEHVVVVAEGRLAGLITALDVARVCGRDSGFLPGQRLGSGLHSGRWWAPARR
jgi:CBS domain-containing protein